MASALRKKRATVLPRRSARFWIPFIYPPNFISIILGTLANFFIFSGIKRLDASTASIVEISYPFFIVLFSYVLFRSTPNIYFFIGGILVFIGSVIIIKFA
ncbi:DMT family transporter [Patescibacteria group bacterium]|nr:DMT family transporter [Patescibacteria group bacterium]MBU1662981.1 DMT family transporter [Patescibacteria group bacterium]MBU1933959.1 DMT family transporter [Patescibacteria group bacterium]MBU2008186.1 DMT family transporter [Patescibacteria group bacterium]MBU2233247.1 DMT family transporter [Patescibacteria group bacterium]